MSENFIFLDCETFLGNKETKQPPQVVSVALCDREGATHLLHFNEPRTEKILKALLENDDIHLGAHWAFFDFSALYFSFPNLQALICEKYDKGLIYCSLVNEKLWDIDEGTYVKKSGKNDEGGARVGKYKGREYRFYQYGLADVTAYHLDWEMDKSGDTWRLRYEELFDVPICDWPEDAVTYAKDDVVAGIGIIEKRHIHHATAEETQAQWACGWLNIWGIGVDLEKVKDLEAETQEEFQVLKVGMEAAGFAGYKGPKKNPKRNFVKKTKPIQKAVEVAYAKKGEKVPLTKGGATSTSADTIRESGAPELKIVSEYVSTQRLLSTYIKALFKAAESPDGRIHPSYNVLVETHRTSCGGPNMQNPPRKGGVRPCFIPEEGNVFVTCDYDSLEMRTLAQIQFDLFDRSVLGDALNSGLCPHVDLAASFLGLSYEEANGRYLEKDAELKSIRQLMKIGNFGYAGGMQAASFIDYCRGYKVHITLAQAEAVYEAWFSKWVEMAEYFEWIKSEIGEDEGPITNPRTKRTRWGTFTQAANFPFQGMAAVGAKKALYEVVRCCNHPEINAFEGCTPVLFLHDEIMIEAPESRIHEAGLELSTTMIQAMETVCPDVRITAQPAAMRAWIKDAEPVYNSEGRLTIYEPKEL